MTAALLVITGLTLTVSGPATADAGGSLAYIAGGNVWVSALDGTSARQVTNDGTSGDPYISVSEDSNGVVYAVRDNVLYELRHDGQAVHAPVDLTPDNKGWVSPDGRVVASTFVEPNGIGMVTSTDYTVLATGVQINSGYEIGNPQWANTSTVVGIQGPDPVYQQATGGGGVDDLLVPTGYVIDVHGVGASADGTVTAEIGGANGGSVIALLQGSGFAATTAAWCVLTINAGAGSRVAVSPDGSQVWWDTGSGIAHLTMQTLGTTTACSAIGAGSNYVVPGGSGVAYSSASVDTEAALPVPPTTAPPTTAPPKPPVHKKPVATAALKGAVLSISLPAYAGKKVVAWLAEPHHKWAKVATLKLSKKATASLTLSKAWRKKVKRKSVVRFLYGKKVVATLTVH